MRKLLTVFIVLMLVLGVSGVGYADSINLIENGDFEGAYTYDTEGNCESIESWNISGNVDIWKADSIAESLGMKGNYAVLGGGSTAGESSLSQTFSVTEIEEITVSFNWAFIYGDLSFKENDKFISIMNDENGLQLDITMQELADSSSFVAGVNTGRFSKTYILSEYGITADEAGLNFILEEAEDSWCSGTDSIAGIDNVSVVAGITPVPEPATMLLLGTGLAGIAVFARKKQYFKK